MIKKDVWVSTAERLPNPGVELVFLTLFCDDGFIVRSGIYDPDPLVSPSPGFRTGGFNYGSHPAVVPFWSYVEFPEMPK